VQTVDIGSNRWCIYIDIEGFGQLYGRDDIVIFALHDLMEAVFLIGKNCYPESPNRIFAHQTGDGFAIVSDFHTVSLEVPVAISIALLRHVAADGRFAKASIGEGDFADITGLYPNCVIEARTNGGSVRMGGGLRTIFPVMGTALINAHNIGKQSPKGSLLTLASSNRERVPKECIIKEVAGGSLISIDWVHSQIPLVSQIQERAELKTPTSELIRALFVQYKLNQNPPQQWVDSTSQLLNLSNKM
jgi:hypothetical protein